VLTCNSIGAHMPRGRVTSMPPPMLPYLNLAGPGPNVSAPLFDFRNHSSVSSGHHGKPAAIGYSPAHIHHAHQTTEWSQRAYRGMFNSTPGGMLSLNLEVYEPYIDPKSRPVLVTVRLYLAVDISLILTIKPANKRRLKCPLNDYGC
jgi:hypothetical protein